MDRYLVKAYNTVREESVVISETNNRRAALADAKKYATGYVQTTVIDRWRTGTPTIFISRLADQG